MTKYNKPTLEICLIIEEDIIMTSGVTLPNDDFDNETPNAGEP